MLDNGTINRIIGVQESYKAPDRLMEMLMGANQRQKLFTEFLSIESDLSYDWFTNYFQDEQGDRASLKQDYTPDCLTDLLCRLSAGNRTYRDVCAGCGGLTIKTWQANKSAEFVCEEFSSRAIPFLLFNLGIRMMNATVIQRDVLTMQTSHAYKLHDGQFEIIDGYQDECQDVCISNPPYSLKFEAVDDYADDSRYVYGLPPKKAADYCFTQHCLYYCRDKTYLILPHGVLFRGNREEQIRRNLIESNMIETIIGLPENMFLNTGIPVQMMVLNKHKQDDGILFIDASKGFEKVGKQNRMSEGQISMCLEAYKSRSDADLYAHYATIAEIKGNDFNLNIPRYVDTSVHEDAPDLLQSISEYNEIKAEIEDQEKKLFGMIDQLQGTNPDAEAYLQKIKKDLKAPSRKNTKKAIKHEEKAFIQQGMDI